MSFEIGEQVYLEGPADTYVVVHQSRLLVSVNHHSRLVESNSEHERTKEQFHKDYVPIEPGDLTGLIDIPDKTLNLGRYRGRTCSLIVLDTDEPGVGSLASDVFAYSEVCFDDKPIVEGFEWHGLRVLLPSMSNDTFLLVSRALQLYVWNKDHRFCGRCGSSTQPSKVDRAWQCNQCDLLFYPRISPCVIGLVTDGPRILLARGMKHKPELFSCLAGFIEPGESAEQAFAREVKEEVSLDIKNIRYYGSQPWPFPGQLMLGFYADYAGGELEVDGVEILEANWYTAENLPVLPSEYSISGTIIRDYLKRV